MGKIVSSVLKIAAIAVNFIPGIGQLASLAITAGLSLASAALAPKAPKVSPAQRERLYATIDPSTPRKIVFGQTAMATDIRYEEWSGTNQEYLDRIVVVASHKVQAIEEIWFDDKLAWTSAGGVQSPYSGYLTVQTRLEGSAGNTIAINGGSKWGSSRRLTGCAYVHLRYKTTGNSKKTESPFASSIPQRMTIKGKGALLYDPRLDSTVGGSGSQRADDQSTWAWTSDAAGNNPALQMLWYLLGWRINGKLAVGRGIPKSRILMSAFIAAANLCEEAVSLAAGGSEPRYRSAGVVSEADAPSAVIDAIEASCAGTLRDASGRLALDILHNDLATALSPGLTDADVIGQCDWQQTKSLDESFNVVRGRYTDPSNNALYQLVDYPAVSLPSPDGLERIHVFDLSMVQSASQAQRLAKQELQRAQYQGVFKGEFKATAWRCQVGSIVPFTFSALGFSNKLFRVVEQVVRMDGTCGLVLREENAAIYAWATEETAPVQAAAPTPYDPNNSPLILGIIEGDNPNSLTINEKISNRIPKENDRSGTNGRYPTVRARMVALGLSVTALDSASAAWIAHRDAVPGWNNTSFHSTIVRTTWDALDKAFDDQLNLGDIAISQEDAKRAVVGGGVTDTAGNPIYSDNVRNNLALVDWWKAGAAIPWAGNGGSSNELVTMPHPSWPLLKGPRGGVEDVFLARADASGGGAGGWNAAPVAPLNPDKTYRFVLPVLQPSDNSAASAYWGTENVCELNTTTPYVNPYFAASPSLPRNRWVLLVGYIFPRNSTGKSSDSAGIWDCQTGEKIAGGLNFCFRPDGLQPIHRAYQYYAAPFVYQFIGKPLIECIDGTESDLRAYFGDNATLNNAIQINASGQFVNPVGTGSGTTVANNQITIAGGAIAGIGTGNGALVGNDQIQIDANGNFINAAGAGSGTNIANALVALRFTGSVSAYAVMGNSLKNVSGSWNELIYTEDSYVNGASVSATMVSGYSVIGLSTKNILSGPPENGTVDYRMYRYPDAGTYYYGGPSLGWTNSGHPIGTNDRVSITYDNQKVRFYVNGVQIHSVDAIPNQRLYGTFVAGYSAGEFKNIEFGPFSDNVTASALTSNKFTSRGSTSAIIEGNSIRRSSGNGDYNCFVTGQQMAGACFAEMIVAGGWNMVALDPVAGSGSYDSQDFVVHVNSGVGGNFYSNGVSIVSGLAAPTIGQTLRVTYDGNRYQVFLDGVQYGPDIATIPGKSHYPIYNAYNGPGAYLGLNYGPYSPASAETKFIVQSAAGTPALRLIGTNTIKRDADGGNWNSQCYSEQGYSGGAFASFTPEEGICYFMAGLNSDPLTDASYGSIDYAFYMPASTDIRIYESGGAVINPSGGASFGTWTPGTVLSVVYDNEFVRYLINGRECRAVRTTNGRKFHFDSSIVNERPISNLRFGPVTPDTASADFIHAGDHQGQLGNSVYKNGLVAVNGWNTKSVSRQMQRGNAVISAKLPTTGTFFGLHQLGNGNTTYDSLAWSFHRSDNGRWYIYEAGGVGLDMGTSYGGVTFGNETEFRIEYDGVRVRYWADGALMREVTSGVSINITYQAGVAIYAQDQRVSNIQFGTFTDNAWSNVGGSGRPQDNATNDRYVDSRNANELPSWYRSNYTGRTAHEFKDAYYLGVPGAVAVAYYGSLVTRVDYIDGSGGRIKQEFTYGVTAGSVVAGQKYTRVSSSESGWSSWVKDFSAVLPPRLGSSGELLTEGGAALTDALARNDLQQWSQVNGKDVWLTDGRIPTGIDGAGWNIRGIREGTGGVVPNIDLMGTPNGTNIAKNPEFLEGSFGGWSGYDNSGGGKLSWVVEDDLAAPNASGKRLRITYDGTGAPNSNPTPGFGGAVQYLFDSQTSGFGGRAAPGNYARNTTIIFSIIASIPSGRTINFASNSIGAEASFEWLSSNAGTGNWQRYVGRLKIGSTGTFSSTAYLYIDGGPNIAFNWYIAKFDQIDISSAVRTILGSGGLVRENGLPLFDADVRNQLQQWTDIQGSLKPENNADVTSYITGSAKIVIECDANGTPLSGQLTKNTPYKLMKNGVDETFNATWSSSTVLSGTITQSTNGAGVNAITAIGSNLAKIRITATLGSAVRWLDVDVEKRLAPPETGGSSSGGTSATTPVNSTIATDGMGTVSSELIFNTGSAGTATLTGNVNFVVGETGGNRTVLAFWIWQRWNGSSWVDVDTEVESNPDCIVTREYEGAEFGWIYYISAGTLAVAKTVTGLSANSQVKFRLRARRVAGSGEVLYLNTNGVNIGGQGS